MNKDDMELMDKLFSKKSNVDTYTFLSSIDNLKNSNLIRKILLDAGMVDKKGEAPVVETFFIPKFPVKHRLVVATNTNTTNLKTLKNRIDELINICKKDENLPLDFKSIQMPYMNENYIIRANCKKILEVKKFFHFSEPNFNEMSCEEIMSKLEKKILPDRQKLEKLKRSLNSLIFDKEVTLYSLNTTSKVACYNVISVNSNKLNGSKLIV